VSGQDACNRVRQCRQLEVEVAVDVKAKAKAEAAAAETDLSSVTVIPRV
jgi:hypothetical protein